MREFKGGRHFPSFQVRFARPPFLSIPFLPCPASFLRNNSKFREYIIIIQEYIPCTHRTGRTYYSLPFLALSLTISISLCSCLARAKAKAKVHGVFDNMHPQPSPDLKLENGLYKARQGKARPGQAREHMCDSSSLLSFFVPSRKGRPGGCLLALRFLSFLALAFCFLGRSACLPGGRAKAKDEDGDLCGGGALFPEGQKMDF